MVTVKPAIVNVGDEIVLGEHKNHNQHWLFQLFQEHHFPVQVALALPDNASVIASWIQQLHATDHYPIFVSGGIGGTHDDCTREGIAKGLGVELTKHEKCFQKLSNQYRERFNESRQRMAWLPEGCELITNPFGAPGFRLKGVYAFPGFPKMLQIMAPPVLKECLENIEYAELECKEITLPLSEGDISEVVEGFSNSWPSVKIGVYAHSEPRRWNVTIRLRYPKSQPDTFEAFLKAIEDFERFDD